MGSRPDEVNFSIYLILPAALGPGVYSTSNINEYQKQKKVIMFVESKVWPAHRTDNHAVICEPIVWTVWDP
jgi:hypothetical protein